jgi:hypothetical protein
VLDWKNQAIEILNAPGFSVTDHGPLHGDIRTFKIRRDEHCVLFVDTEAVRGGYFPMREVPAGTVRVNRDKMELENPSGTKAVLTGVDGLTRVESGDTVRETARIHQFTVTLPDSGPAAYTVEWLENLPSHHAWPNIVERVDGTKKNLSFTDTRITVADPEGLLGVGRHAAILEVAGHKLYIWGPRSAMEGPTPRSGCIIYEGVPDDRRGRNSGLRYHLLLEHISSKPDTRFSINTGRSCRRSREVHIVSVGERLNYPSSR